MVKRALANGEFKGIILQYVDDMSFIMDNNAEATQYHSNPKQCSAELKVFYGMFSIFTLNVRNILHNIVNPTEHCLGYE